MDPSRLNYCVRILCFTLTVGASIVNCQTAIGQSTNNGKEGIAVDRLADVINNIVAANRKAYSKIIVERLVSREGVITAVEDYEKNKALPLPAQLFRLGADISRRQVKSASYSLQSFWAIRRGNLPSLEIEKIGLAHVLGGKKKSYGVELVKGTNLFIAAYPDIATSSSCVSCHNRHPGSRKHDFKLGDVMGGVIVRIPLPRRLDDGKNRQNGSSSYSIGATADSKKATINYRTAADIVHGIVSANREAYSKQVVHRLVVKEKVIQADEQFLKLKALPLPAQVFREGAQLANQKNSTITYSLRSIWALRSKNGPTTELEKAGLAHVANGNDRFYGKEQENKTNDFVAIYPDKATITSCVSCHNNHKDSPRRDFRLGDVIGGVVVRIPLSK